MNEQREFRVVYKFESRRQRSILFQTEEGARRRLILLTSDAPWEAYGDDPDAEWCCDGYYCGCKGMTVRERHENLRRLLPALEFARLEARAVGEWETEDEPAITRGGAG